jgi:hypothetical protein
LQFDPDVWILRTAQVVAVNEKPNQTPPDRFALEQNYPNPFNPSTRISFTIPHSSFVILKVFDVLGREVATLVNEVMRPGTYERTFEGTDLTSGVYFCHLQAGRLDEVKKMIIIR